MNPQTMFLRKTQAERISNVNFVKLPFGISFESNARRGAAPFQFLRDAAPSFYQVCS